MSLVCRVVVPDAAERTLESSTPLFLAPGAPPDLLPFIGALLGPESLLVMCCCNSALHDSVTGAPLESVWHGFLGECSRPLLTNSTSSMRRYLEIMTLDLTGTWVDAGINVHEREKYRYLTAMRVTKKRGIEHNFEAVSFMGDREVKVSRGRLDGAVYVCYEHFEDINNGKMDAAPINMARGVLDLRDVVCPTISGTWIQCEPPPEDDDVSDVLDKWLDNPLCLTTGSFEFTKVDGSYDERAGWNPELRLRAGLPSLKPGVPVCDSLYVCQTLTDEEVRDLV